MAPFHCRRGPVEDSRGAEWNFAGASLAMACGVTTAILLDGSLLDGFHHSMDSVQSVHEWCSRLADPPFPCDGGSLVSPSLCQSCCCGDRHKAIVVLKTDSVKFRLGVKV
jgi:hypothetical protein